MAKTKFWPFASIALKNLFSLSLIHILLRPEGHHPLCAAGKGYRPGGVAPAPPEEILPALPLHEKGIVAPVPDGPVVKDVYKRQVYANHTAQRLQ